MTEPYVGGDHVKRTIVLPWVDKDGNDLAPLVYTIRELIAELAGGYTTYSAVGVWRDDNGAQVTDSSSVVVVTSPPIIDAKIAARLPRWAFLLRLTCLYTDWHRVNVKFALPEE